MTGRLSLLCALAIAACACGDTNKTRGTSPSQTSGVDTSPKTVCKHLLAVGSTEELMRQGPDKYRKLCAEEMAQYKKLLGEDLYQKYAVCLIAVEGWSSSDQQQLSACEQLAGPHSIAWRKARTTEARELVKKLYDGARAYYMDGNYGAGSLPIPAQFPEPGVGPMPPLGTCCKNEGGKCLPDASLWASPTWVALQFSVDDPHYYSYQYIVSNGKAGATDGSTNFRVIAFGDLDCDGEYSRLEMYGEITSMYADGPQGSAELSRTDELE